jgi:hypothetical protein
MWNIVHKLTPQRPWWLKMWNEDARQRELDRFKRQRDATLDELKIELLLAQEQAEQDDHRTERHTPDLHT